ncbi:hypothetical protein B0H17DRAFT_920112 [Mycena rosella]|uniref:SET domain-containing protein n=1 Tax=Mycena rosella TaxID=1033263 RepID=A0AAD7M846_MYCRO|nr:hypothetical protein B0H17DRAFT_920112 [Mycena rosella]
MVWRQANEAFGARDYQTATSLYSHAVALDPANPLYVLNRAMSNLKLANWKDAESDATAALELSTGNAVQMRKAFFRRSRARKAQGDLTGARADLEAFVAHGGKQNLADEETLLDPSATTVAFTPRVAKQAASEVKDTARMGKGAFATRTLHRGDLILAEKPLIRHSDVEQGGYEAILSAVDRLSPGALCKVLSLQRPQAGNIFIGIYRTNALPDGLCHDASRFNHSCLPNARYSWHAKTGQQRIFALTDIAAGEEICVTYLGGRNVYGSTREERRRRFLTNFSFACLCAACSLAPAALEASDARRREAAILYDRMMTHEPRVHGERVLRDAVRAIRLLREEGYAGDADDYATDAGGLCALHSDWDSAKYWAKFSYDCRCAEFGTDHEHARRAKKYCDDPRTFPQAGMYSGQKFPHRV